MKFKIKDLENYLERKLPKNIEEILTNKAFETVKENDVLDVDILPNRFSDAGSLIGLAKEISLLTENKIKLPKIKIKESSKKIQNFISVINKTNKAPFYLGRIILNVKNQESPKWLKEFVEFYNLNSVNLLVDLANFVMFEYNAPLHIFDLDKIKERKIIIRESKKGEKFISLDEKEYILDEGNILITDPEKILALGGIKGSKSAEVTLETKNIFIEAAVFDPAQIYQTSKKLNISTEASFRFERKIIYQRSLQALERLTSSIQNLGGGEVLKGRVELKKKKPVWSITFKERKIDLDYQRIKKYLGIEIKESEVKKIIEKIKKAQPERIDLTIEEDLYEEILRIYGLEKIKKEFETPKHSAEIDKNLKFNFYLEDLLKEIGYSEVYLYNFLNEKDKEIFKEPNKEPILIKNPISENYKYYSFTLLPGLLKAVSLNQRNFKEVKIFNISKTRSLNEEERFKLAIVYAGQKREEVLKELKTCLNYLGKKLNIQKFDFNDKEFNFSKLSAEIWINKNIIGVIGLFSKKIEKTYDVDLNVGFLEIDLEELKKHINFAKKFIYWGDFPEIKRDISFLVDKKIRFPQIEKILNELEINNLKEIKIIDIYLSQNYPDKKSFTLRFVFQNPKRTLKEKEIDVELEKIIRNLKENFEIELR